MSETGRLVAESAVRCTCGHLDREHYLSLAGNRYECETARERIEAQWAEYVSGASCQCPRFSPSR